MANQLEMRFDADPDWALVRLAIAEHANRDVPRYEKLWAYFRNPLELVGLSGTAGGGWYRSAQEMGLPVRIKGRGDGLAGSERGRREVVIENDIGWRVQTMVDFMFGNPVRIESTSGDEALKSSVEGLLERVWERSGGIELMQDLATLGHVYGHVDLLVRIDEELLMRSSLEDAHEAISIEPIDARRGVAIVSAEDYRELDGYAVHFERDLNQTVAARRERGGRVSRVFGGGGRSVPRGVERKRSVVTEVFDRHGWKRFEDDELVAGGSSDLLGGVVPVVHIQNMRQPFVYEGIGEVEVLVGLQDELNTRLSDRANRVTLQSFQMYLAKGIEGFSGTGVGPGVVWSTDNPDASIERFGGDMSSPSEERHIDEIREAMDKVSGVPPLAGGVVRSKLGNLSSANALRVTLMGLIAKTNRKRVGYGRGIESVCALILGAMDRAGVLGSSAGDRGVRVVWPELAITDEREQVAAAKGKIDLGIPIETVVSELGYERADPGIV